MLWLERKHAKKPKQKTKTKRVRTLNQQKQRRLCQEQGLKLCGFHRAHLYRDLRTCFSSAPHALFLPFLAQVCGCVRRSALMSWRCLQRQLKVVLLPSVLQKADGFASLFFPGALRNNRALNVP